MRNYTNPSFKIILYNTTPVGRIYINRAEKEIRIIDIALLKEYRNKGIGTKILNDIIRESEESLIPLSLYVEYYNFAKKWYLKLKFKVVEETGVYSFMIRTPEK